MVAGLDHARDQVDDDHHQGRDDFVVGDGMPVEHHVWYINTVGLQSSVINSIAVCKYKRDDGVVEGTVCAVCLSEFQEGESLRLLPKCNHAFHVSCIDAWLRSHTNCPMCRAPIVSMTTTRHPNSQLPPPLDDDHLSSARNHHLHAENNSSFRQEPEATRAGLRETQLISGKMIRRTMSTGSCLLAVSRDSHSIDIAKMGAETRGAVGNEGSSSALPSSLMHRGLGAMKRSISCSGKLMSSS